MYHPSIYQFLKKSVDGVGGDLIVEEDRLIHLQEAERVEEKNITDRGSNSKLLFTGCMLYHWATLLADENYHFLSSISN